MEFVRFLTPTKKEVIQKLVWIGTDFFAQLSGHDTMSRVAKRIDVPDQVYAVEHCFRCHLHFCKSAQNFQMLNRSEVNL